MKYSLISSICILFICWYTIGELGFSDIDNILNWNTSSSFENVSTPSRPIDL